MKLNAFLFIVFFLIALLSCGSRQVVTVPLEPDIQFETAMEYFKAGKYDKAIPLFEKILFYHPSSEYVDDAQYWLGKAYFEKKDYNQAIIEFDYLIKNFTTSKFIEDAYFYRAKSYLNKAPGYEKDPTETENAITLFDQFLTKFPGSRYIDEVKKSILSARNRLAKKELENGKLYIKLGEKDAALLYFNYVMENYPETDASNEAKYLAATLYEKKGMTEEALNLYKALMEEEEWKERVKERIERINQKDQQSVNE